MMRILLIGKGGREHALAWKFSQSQLLSSLYLWPGNAAMAGLGENLPLPADASIPELVATAQKMKIDLIVSGPEAPLSQGVADAFASVGIPTFGPQKAAAQLEASKAFAKEVMAKAGIPTAAYQVVQGEAACLTEAKKILAKSGGVVIKASGLAAGKGVFVCKSEADIEQGLRHLFHTEMRDAATTVVLEEILLGRECSYFSFIGAKGALSLGFAVDYKRLNDGDEGPNTGGMGCYTPVPWLPEDAALQVHKKVIDPLLDTLRRDRIDYCGCLYVGLMWSETKGPQVVEFNVRLGDPEAQVLAVFDDRDWLALMAASAGLDLPEGAFAAAIKAPSAEHHAVAVVMAAESYPYGTDPGLRATLPRSFFKATSETQLITFGAGLESVASGELRTGSGRVLTVSARAPSFAVARAVAYQRVEEIGLLWRGARWRRDIGKAVI